MPEHIQASIGRSLKHTYAADGRKLIAAAQSGDGEYESYYSYAGNLVFDGNNELEYIIIPEGRILYNKGLPTIEYHLKDHLGNVRVAFTPGFRTPFIAQDNTYYPFGGLIKDLSYDSPTPFIEFTPGGYLSMGAGTNPFRYNGKELVNAYNLGWYDYGSRYYNPALGLFNSVDPQAHKFPGWNPYAYGLNSPMNYIDPNGELPFLAIIGIGAAIGALTGGIRGAIAPDMTFWDGLWRGGLVGTIGGVLSPLGGGSFMSSVIWGMSEGAITGGIDAALWGNNIEQGMLWGAAAGVVFGTLSSENFSNLTKGKGFYNNEMVFENFKAGKYAIAEGSSWQQEALNYFGFKGTYDPSNKMLDQAAGAAVTHPKTGEIIYGDFPFDANFDRLAFTADHEMRHSANVLSGKYNGMRRTFETDAMEEWRTYMHNYRNQGLYPKHGFSDIASRITQYGTAANVYKSRFFSNNDFFY